MENKKGLKWDIPQECNNFVDYLCASKQICRIVKKFIIQKRLASQSNVAPGRECRKKRSVLIEMIRRIFFALDEMDMLHAYFQFLA